MQVQELDDLADWFKKNVLDIHKIDDEINGLEAHKESSYIEAVDVSNARLNVEQLKEPNDELSLIEYIIGIDGI